MASGAGRLRGEQGRGQRGGAQPGAAPAAPPRPEPLVRAAGASPAGRAGAPGCGDAPSYGTRARPGPLPGALRGRGVKYLLIGLLRVYRAVISPLYGQVCRYYPSCSAYALDAVREHGSIRGAGWPSGAWHAVTHGRPAASTTCLRVADRRHALNTSPRSLTRGNLRRHRQLHHDAALLRHLGDPAGLARGVQPGPRPRGRTALGAVDHRPDAGDPDCADPAVREADQVPAATCS